MQTFQKYKCPTNPLNPDTEIIEIKILPKVPWLKTVD